jgi:hypothetical protein
VKEWIWVETGVLESCVLGLDPVRNSSPPAPKSLFLECKNELIDPSGRFLNHVMVEPLSVSTNSLRFTAPRA